MVVNMLKAVSQILDIKETGEALTAFERVKCAKIMLDEIIKGMDVDKTRPFTPPPTELIPSKPSSLAKELEKPEPVYTMEIDKVTKTLKWMKKDDKPLDLKQLLLVDGKKVEYGRALGQPFKQLKVVEDAE